MAKEKREGFGLLPVSIPDETLRLLRWGKAKSGISMSTPLIMEAERKAEEIKKKYGEPPLDFE